MLFFFFILYLALTMKIRIFWREAVDKEDLLAMELTPFYYSVVHQLLTLAHLFATPALIVYEKERFCKHNQFVMPN